MIRVTAELLPKSDDSRRSHLGTITISNDGTGTAEVGNYKAILSKRGLPEVPWREAHFSGFPRKRLGIYDLLLGVLAVAVGDRIPDRTTAESVKGVAREEFHKIDGHEFLIEPCACCGEPGQLWEHQARPPGVVSKVVMCSTAVGDEGECPLAMPPQMYYCATKREAVAFWNKWRAR